MGINNEFFIADIHAIVLWLTERTQVCSASQWSSWQDKESVWINVLCSDSSIKRQLVYAEGYAGLMEVHLFQDSLCIALAPMDGPTNLGQLIYD